jgi:hypothetical protein
MSKFDIFISYSTKDKDFVRRLANDLKENGLTVWLDELNLRAGDSLADEISTAIKNSKFLLVIMSPDYFVSEWATQEWKAAMLDEVDSKNIKVIPILYRPCSVPPMLATKRYLDFRQPESYKESLRILVHNLYALVGSIKSQQPIESPTVGQSVVSVDSSTLAEAINALREAVNAFQSKSQPPSYDVTTPDPTRIEGDLCFIVMPFGQEDLNIVYEDFIKPTLVEECELRCERGDDVFGSNVIMEDIRNSIDRARLIIADLTGRNANVFYEVGIAHALNKAVLLLAQSIDDVPFDLRHRRVLLYEYSPKGCKKLEKDLKAHVEAMLKR